VYIYMSINNEKMKSFYMEKFLEINYNYQDEPLVADTTSDDISQESIDDYDFEDMNEFDINGKMYYHLFEKEMNYDFSIILENTSSKEFIMNMVIMNVNDELKMPFLQYFLVNNNNKLGFPQFSISRKIFDEEMSDLYVSDEDVKDGQENNILIAELERLLSEEYTISTMKYKGYTNKNGEFYVYLMVSNDEEDLTEYGYLTIYDEIVTIKEVDTVKIHDDIVDFFKENINIQQLVDDKEVFVDVPMIGYICKYDKEENELVNIRTDDNYEEKTDHTKFGLNYVFSDNLINDDNIYKKYAIFLSDIYFYFDDIGKVKATTNIGGNNKTDKEMKNEMSTHNSIIYHDSVHCFYFLKNMEQFVVIE